MTEGPRADSLPPFDAESLELLQELPPEYAARVRRFLRERDHLALLHETLVQVEHAPTLANRLTTFVRAIARLGYRRVAIVLRETSGFAGMCVRDGFSAGEGEALVAIPDARDDWERRREAFERSRVSQSYHLRGDDPWVHNEFGDADRSRLPWGEGDVVIVPLRGPRSRRFATLFVADADDGRSGDEARVRTVEIFAQQVAFHLEQDRLTELADRRVERLQQLQALADTISRSLDEREIAEELVRGVTRILDGDGAVVARPDETGETWTSLARLPVSDHHTAAEPVAMADGAIARVARSGEPFLARAGEGERWEAAAEVIGGEGEAGSVLAVPLRVGTRLVGVLAIHHWSTEAFGPEEVDLLLTIGSQAASALSNARLFAESERERRQTEALADIARAVSESLRTGEVMRLILRHAMSLLHADGALIARRKDDYLHVVAAAGTSSVLAGLHLPVNSSITGKAVRDASAVICNDVSADPGLFRVPHELVPVDRMCVVPLIAARGPIGSLSVINRSTDFTDDDARVLHRLADQVAVAIVNARLYEELAEASREWTVAFDAIAIGMVLLDDDGRVVRYNPRALQLADYSTQRELVGRNFYEAVLHEERALVEGCPLHRALIDGVTGRGTVRSGMRARLFDIVASPHPDGGAVVTFDDVTAMHGLSERNRLIVETASDAILTLDMDGRISYANPAAAELISRRGPLAGTLFGETLLEELAEEASAREQDALAGSAQRFESTVVRGDGERRIISVSLAPLQDAEGVIGIVAALRDMTDERRARDAVVQSETRYRNLFDSAADAIYTLDAHGSVTSANQAAVDLLGVPREELLGRALDPFVADIDRGMIVDRFRTAFEERESRFECTLVRPDGGRRLVSVTNTPIRHGRRVIGVLGIARDITEQREHARALQRSEARFENLVESAPDGIFTLDEEGQFTSVNRAFERAVGRIRADLIGTHFTATIDPRDRDHLWEVFVGALNGRRLKRELRYLGADGRSPEASVQVSPVVDEGDRVTGVLGVIRDVSAEKRLVEQLLQQEKLAAIGQLVSGIAHELNNPLASVMAFSELVLAEQPDGAPSDTGEMLQTIHDEARRAAKIVANLLTFARQHPPQRMDSDVGDVLRTALELRRYALTVHGITMEEHLDDDLPRTWADPFQLQQVFLNLLSNAEDAVHDRAGLRRIGVRAERRGSLIVVSVSDTGPGVAASETDRIFNPFYSTRPVGKGSGLGLSIADGIVREHGGRIRVESTPGGGATFVVELPLRPSPVTAPAALPVPEPVISTAVRSILVIDDEPAIRSAVSRYFAHQGHTVEAVGSAADALQRLDEREYDIILLDLRMPEMSGDALYELLRDRDPVHAARVVFLTGDAQSDDARAFLEASGCPTVGKPFSLEELDRIVLTHASA
ncbi:MAG TPA: PAS domain S-box protein [Gemmatimonadaceae bacterium]|nr:PAS domain S-box protein [Gemmatimonadaceae bacterium]